MKITTISILFFVFISSLCLSQNTKDTVKTQRLNLIYRNLEYNTTAFNDLKNKWVITDPIFVREIYNRFIVKNALKLDGKKPSLKMLKEKTKDIYSGDVFIELRKRYYDGEIEKLRFFTESKLDTSEADYFFDSVNDNIYLREILGEVLYNNLKKQFYAHNDLTKSYFDNKLAYNYDIYFHITNPVLMFWGMTTKSKNKYLVYFMGKWGNDRIAFPGWYYPDYMIGLKIAYIDYLLNNEAYNSYTFDIGIGVPARQITFDFNKDPFGQRLFHTGTNVYAGLEGYPFKFIGEKFKRIKLSISGMFSITEFKTKDFGFDYVSQFYSNRNYFSLFFDYRDIMNLMDFGWLHAGLGVSSFDVYHYFYDPLKDNLQDLEPQVSSKFDNVINTEIGLSTSKGLLQHDLSFDVNYVFNKGYGYAGIKAHFMLSNTIGIDFSFYQSFKFNTKSLPFYRLDNYIVFSPIIRINY